MSVPVSIGPRPVRGLLRRASFAFGLLAASLAHGQAAPADLRFSITDSVDPVAPYAYMDYTFTATNAGGAAANVALATANPAGTGFISMSTPAGWSCTTPQLGFNGAVDCTATGLAGGASATFVMQVQVHPANPGTVFNVTGNLTTSSTESFPSDNLASETTTVANAPIMEASVTYDHFNDINGNTGMIGDEFFYYVGMYNSGNVDLTNVVISVPGMVPDSHACGTVAPGNNCLITPTHTITAADVAAGTYTGTATFTSDQTGARQASSITLDVYGYYELTLAEAMTSYDDNDGNGVVSLGDTLHYTISGTNNGDTTLTSVYISDYVMDDTQTLACGTLVVGDSCSFTPTHVVTAAEAAQGAVYSAPSGSADQFQTGVYGAQTVVPVIATPEVSAVKTLEGYGDYDGSGDISRGDSLIYRITITNTGTVGLTLLQATDPLLPMPSGSCGSGWPVAPGDSCYQEGNYTVTQADADAGSITNTATVTAQEMPDGPQTNTVVTPVATHPQLAVYKTMTGFGDGDGNGVVSVGEYLNYEVVAYNSGDVTVTNVVVTDPLLGAPQDCASVAPAASCVLTGNYLATGDDAFAGAITNTAQATSDQTGVVASNTVVTAATGHPSMNLTSGIGLVHDVDGSNTMNYGDTIEFTFEAFNTGDMPLASVTIDAPRLVPAQANCGTIAVGATCILAGLHTIDLDDVASGQVELTATAFSPTQDTTAQTYASTSPVVSNPAASLFKTFDSFDDLDGSGTLNRGDVMHYTLLATNMGDLPLPDARIDDPLLSPTQHACGTIAIGATCTMTGTHTVTQGDADAGLVVNTGTLVAGSTIPPQPSNGVTTPISSAPALTLQKTFNGYVDNDTSGNVSEGDTLEYSIEARNTGDVRLTNVVVDDPLITPATGNCASVEPGRTCTLNGMHTVTAADVLAGVVRNTASVIADQVAVPVASNTIDTPVAANPPTLAIAGGDGQGGYDGQTSQPLVVELLDFAGTPIEGATIAWTGAANDTSVTDAAGRATNSVAFPRTPGAFAVTAAHAPSSLQVQFNLRTLDAALAVQSGDGLVGEQNQPLPEPLVVLATDDGAAVAGAPITWTVLSGEALVTAADANTNGAGVATASLEFGARSGPVQVQAQRTDSGDAVVFNLTVDVRRALNHDIGDNQVGIPGQTLPDELGVEAWDDETPAEGVQIRYTVVSGDATVPACCETTNVAGRASTPLTLGATPGIVQVRAERVDDPTVFVTFTATSVDHDLVMVSGDGLRGRTGLPILAYSVVEARKDGVAEANAAIVWSITGDATLAYAQGTTGADGRAMAGATCGATAGPVVVTATRADDASRSVTFNHVCYDAALTLVAGDMQTAQLGQEFAQPLVARLTEDGVPVEGAPVQWSVTVGTGTGTVTGDAATDANGEARAIVVAGTTAGHFAVSVLQNDRQVSQRFRLLVTNIPMLSIASGDGQSGLASTQADAPLAVQLVDALGDPIVGQAIEWAVTAGNGMVSASSTPTDASGRAEVALTFGATSGPVSVTASTAGGATPVVFTATALDAAIGVASGDGQVAPINTRLPQPLVVQVGEPVQTTAKGGRATAQGLSGVPVTFTVTAGGGVVDQVVVATDASGQASTGFTLGSFEGAQTVAASVPGGASITFTATGTVARTLVLESGDGQAGAPGVALPNPLVVRAQDNGADAAGIAITWSVSTGSATIAASGPTGADGLADATVTAGTTPGTLSIRAERADDATAFVTFAVTAAQLRSLPGLNPTQRELAVAIDETCVSLAGMPALTPEQADFLARCQELIAASVIDPGSATQALDSLLPGLALAMQEAAFNAAQSQFQNLKARIAALRSGTQGTSFQGLALSAPSGTVSLGDLGTALAQDETPAPASGDAGGDFQRWGFFAAGTIGRGEAEVGSTRPAYDYDINGLTAGLDYRYNDRFIFGAALGYTRQDMELAGQPGTMDMSGLSVSGYATYYRDNSWYTDAVLTWGRNEFDLVRSVTYTVPLPGGGSNTIDQTARSQSDGDMIEAAFTFGRDFQAGGWSIGPYGRLLYTRLDFDEIHDEMEDGEGSGLGLSIDARSLTSVASEIGAKFTYAHSTDWGVVTPHAQVEWEHEFKDDPKALTARFLADPNGTPFTLSGEEVDTDYFRMSVGLSIIMSKGRSGFLIYERTVGREGFDQANLGFGIRIEF